jgi:phosphate:Na+ symporter
MENTTQSIETSSLHLDMISDLKRINSHICSIAYPILEQAGVLAKTRLKEAPAQSQPSAVEAGGDPAIDKRKPRTA